MAGSMRTVTVLGVARTSKSAILTFIIFPCELIASIKLVRCAYFLISSMRAFISSLAGPVLYIYFDLVPNRGIFSSKHMIR